MKRKVHVISGVCSRCRERTAVVEWYEDIVDEPSRSLCEHCLEIVTEVAAKYWKNSSADSE